MPWTLMLSQACDSVEEFKAVSTDVCITDDYHLKRIED